MEYRELPDKYKKLVLLRNFQNDKEYNDSWNILESIEICQQKNYLPSLFDWSMTREGSKFWSQVCNFKLESNLPIIPEESEDEIRSFFLEEKVNPVSSIDSPVKREFLISKAREKYPIGTVVSNKNLPILTDGTHIAIKNHNDFFISEGEVCYQERGHGSWTLSHKKEWADIVEAASMSPKKNSAEYFPDPLDRKISVEELRKKQEYERECERVQLFSYPVHLEKLEKEFNNTTQPIVEARVKTKSKSKRLIYKHY